MAKREEQQEEVRVIVHMQPALRDFLKRQGKQDGRVLMRQIEHILKQHAAGAEPIRNARTSKER